MLFYERRNVRLNRDDAARDSDGAGKPQRARHGAKADALPLFVPLFLAELHLGID